MLDTLPALHTLATGAAQGETFESQVEAIIPIIAIGVGGLIALVAVVFGTVSQVLKVRAVEISRREIAAYVAEGSISADEARRLMETQITGSKDSCG